MLHAQDDNDALPSAQLQKRLKDLTTADATGNAEAIANYQSALDQSRQLQEWRKKADQYRQQTEAANATRQNPTTDTVALQPDEVAPDEKANSDDLASLTSRFETINARLASTRAAVQASADEEKLRQQRLAELPDLIVTATAKLAASPAPLPPLASASELERSEYQRQLVERELLRQQREALQAELQFYESSSGSFAVERSRNQQRLAGLTQSADAWQKLIDRRRLSSTEQAAQRAKTAADQLTENPKAKAIAVEIAEIAGRHEALSQQMAQASHDLARLGKLDDIVSRQHASAVRRVQLLEKAKLRIDAVTGQLLLRQRQELPEVSQLRRQLHRTLSNSAQAQIDLIDLENDITTSLTTGAKTKTASDEQASLLEQLEQNKANQTTMLIDDLRLYISTLSATASRLQTLTTETANFTAFVDQRLLWIPSTQPLGSSEIQTELNAVRTLIGEAAFSSIAEDLRDNLFLWGSALVVFGALLALRPTFNRKLSQQGKAARKRNCTSFKPTLRALGFTILIAAPVPFLAWIVYSRSAGMPEGCQIGLRNLAGFLSTAIFFRVVTHREGLMADHFRIGAARVTVLRKNLTWFIPVMAPLVFFATALPIDISNLSSAGRLFFVGLLVTMLIMLVRTLRPSAKLIYWRGTPDNRLAKLCYLLAILSPAGLILGAVAGYYASVQQLRIQAVISLWLVLVVLFITALLFRWLLVSRRRLAVKQAMSRRAAAAAAAAELEAQRSSGAVVGKDLPRVASVEEEQAAALKVVEVEEQTSRLIRAAAIVAIAIGIWGVWLPTVPAMSTLDKFTLWDEDSFSPSQVTASISASGDASTDESHDSSSAIPDLLPAGSSDSGGNRQIDDASRVSLQDLIAACLALLLTFVAARNIPGLLGLTLIQRMRLAPGGSFAFTTTIRYLIVVVGIIIAFAFINITWGKVQWIAAAITLGIGFGLQEIFANFVAGLIILFERPIRLGDVVTIGEVSGRISEIRIRATTIRQFNSRELIVPNKEFITGQLVNWTLSDSVLRIEIPVGIAYGSDTEKARDILLEIADTMPSVLSDPKPDVLFENFGDSSLGFELRACVGSVEDLIPTQSGLHYEIDRRFREAGIEIAFPQTDIHIRTVTDGIKGLQAAPSVDTESANS